MTTPNLLFEEAIRLTQELNMPIFPCLDKAKAPRVPGGFKAATTNIKIIRTWWQRWPNANIGYPCRDEDLVVFMSKRQILSAGFDPGYGHAFAVQLIRSLNQIQSQAGLPRLQVSSRGGGHSLDDVRVVRKCQGENASEHVDPGIFRIRVTILLGVCA